MFSVAADMLWVDIVQCERDEISQVLPGLLTAAPERQKYPRNIRRRLTGYVKPHVTTMLFILVFQCLTGRAPAYLADDCQLTTSAVSTRRLRSTDTTMCFVRRSNNSFGDRCFAAAGPRLWNRLPIHLRQCDSLEQLKRLLKTHLFGAWDRGAL